jgi:dTDP-4-amino-4,6-dideoxygalactose transaminase
LKNNGIASAIHYPVPLPFMKAYEYLEYSPDDLPNIYAAHQKILSLPMFPELSDDQIEYIVDIINDFH